MTEPYADLWPKEPAAEPGDEPVLHVRVLEGDLQRLRLRRGDKIVVMVRHRISDNEAEMISRQTERKFPGHEIIVLPAGYSLGVIEAPE